MRIAFVTTEYVTENDYDGGLANYLYRVCLSLKKMGHQPIVVVSSNRTEKIMHNGVEVHRVRVLPPHNKFTRMTGGKMPIALIWMQISRELNKTVRRIHKENSLSIIQYASCAATALFRVKEIPAVIRLSSYQPLLHKGYGITAPTEDQKRLEELETKAFRKVDGLFGPSRVIGLEVQKATNIKVDIIETPFVLDAEILDRNPYNQWISGKKYVLFFGTLGILKGVATIAEIIHSLLARNKDLFFVFIGKDFGYRGRTMIEFVREKAREHKGRVIHLGKMPHSQLYPILSRAELVVLPSRTDNFPNTCLEAMAHKKIVIGTKGTSFEQLITDGVNGFLVERDNPFDLLQTIEKALSLDGQKKRVLEEAAYNRILRLSPDIVVKELVDYYKKIMTSFSG
ncbi:glycosyltransferase family 4 protein [Aneurinibacillus danicus]|jgi:glycosyltransferase involved in cell wall biosynthesis|uniref:Glycosyl transferase family 1 domain-containing protein n=1 Tax=Aneurinibacillus danicus TaxID=267746 RepID=A0A511VE62_9BACL|nr:glycosyltransferase family 4 protein [Aneurinibacillus danicus]GEN36721.1 hypothetical protein ADA01nite_41810 [Aneurinibacillus danicus]